MNDVVAVIYISAARSRFYNHFGLDFLAVKMCNTFNSRTKLLVGFHYIVNKI